VHDRGVVLEIDAPQATSEKATSNQTAGVALPLSVHFV
jgi:hypothetical protein